MSEPSRPEWTRRVTRSDRPAIDRHYHPDEDGPLDGKLIWQGDVSDARSQGHYRLFIIEEATSGANFAVPERAALRPLRDAAIGSQVYIEPQGKTDLGGGRQMGRYALFVKAPTCQGGSGGPNPSVMPPNGEGEPF
jgi:excisionase family DNA binding protein